MALTDSPSQEDHSQTNFGLPRGLALDEKGSTTYRGLIYFARQSIQGGRLTRRVRVKQSDAHV
jgi:hypothetical protein